MNLAGALVFVVLFGYILYRARIVSHARHVIERSREAVGVMRNPALDDDAREKAVRSISLSMFALLGKLCLGAVLALGVPLLLTWLLEAAGWLDFTVVMAILANPWFLAATLVPAIAGYYLLRR